jgi:hypothetical protein
MPLIWWASSAYLYGCFFFFFSLNESNGYHDMITTLLLSVLLVIAFFMGFGVLVFLFCRLGVYDVCPRGNGTKKTFFGFELLAVLLRTRLCADV